MTEIFDALSGEVKISVKTRIGKEDPEEFPALLELFNKVSNGRTDHSSAGAEGWLWKCAKT